MVMVDFQNVPDSDGGNYDPVPDGQYKASIKKVDEKQGRKGLYFNCEWVLTDGEFKGKKVWDNLFFTESSLWRVKLVASRLGLPVDGPLDVTPELLTGKQAWLTLATESYRGNDGAEKKKNVITAAGFEEIGEGAVDAPGEDDDLPMI